MISLILSIASVIWLSLDINSGSCCDVRRRAPESVKYKIKIVIKDDKKQLICDRCLGNELNKVVKIYNNDLYKQSFIKEDNKTDVFVYIINDEVFEMINYEDTEVNFSIQGDDIAEKKYVLAAVEYGENYYIIYCEDFESKGELFKETENIRSIKIIKTGEIESYSSMFKDCSVESIDLTGLNTVKTTDMNNMFEGCKKLTSIKLNNFKAPELATANYMFQNCDDLRTVDFSEFYAPELQDMQHMFDGCKNLETVNLSHFTVPKLNNIENIFDKCNNLKTVNLSHLKAAELENVSEIFEEHNNLISVDLSYLEADKLNDMSKMFRKCTNLRDVDLSHSKSKQTIDMSKMFSKCENLKKVNLNCIDFTTNNVESIFKECASLKSIDLSVIKFECSDSKNAEKMFKDCKMLESVKLFECLENNKNINTSDIFTGCINLRYIDMNNLPHGKIEIKDCKKLKRIKMSKIADENKENKENKENNEGNGMSVLSCKEVE